MRIVKNNRVQLIIICTIIILLFTIFYVHGQEQKFISPNTLTVTVNEGFVVELPQIAYWNSKVAVSVEAQPGTRCKLSYINPAGNLTEADGLGVTIANTDGLCTWMWKIDEAGRKGSGRVIVRVGETSETHFIEIRSGY